MYYVSDTFSRLIHEDDTGYSQHQSAQSCRIQGHSKSHWSTIASALRHGSTWLFQALLWRTVHAMLYWLQYLITVCLLAAVLSHTTSPLNTTSSRIQVHPSSTTFTMALPDHMTAAVPDNGSIALQSVPLPDVPATHVLLRVHWTAINRADTLQRIGRGMCLAACRAHSTPAQLRTCTYTHCTDVLCLQCLPLLELPKCWA